MTATRNGESPEYLSDQLITCIGNKRSLLDRIAQATQRVKKRLGKDRLHVFDVFAGSGVVSRFFKAHASRLVSNDFEDYAAVVGRCYLRNHSTVDLRRLTRIVDHLNDRVDREKFRAFLTATKAWQGVHGYQTVWLSPGMAEILKKLKSPAINRLLDEADWTKVNSVGTGNTPFERHQNFFRQWDNYTPRLIAAMEEALKGMK